MSTTVLLIPGAWHHPAIFNEVAAELRKAGYNTEDVYLETVGPREYQRGFRNDVDLVREQVQHLAEAGQKVVVVGHSYGGVVMTEAVYNLDWTTRQSQGKEGGVTHLFYMCSFILSENQSLSGIVGDTDPDWYDVSTDGMVVTPKSPKKIFYNDLPEREAEKWARQLRPHNNQAFADEITHATWQKIPATYLYCEKDVALPLSFQEVMVNEWANGANIRTETIPAAHSPMLSMPKETAAAIVRAAEIEV